MTPSTRSVPIFATLVVLSSCYAPPDERADQDERVGQATLGELSVDVRDGLAAIRHVDEEQLELWAGAPHLTVHLSTGEPLDDYRVVVDNAMPSAEVTADGERLARIPTDHPKRLEIQLDLPRGTTRLEVAEPDSTDTAFRFAVLSDIQEAIDEVDDVFEVMNGEDAKFALGAGDLTERGEPAQLRRFEAELAGLRYPYFATLGNHELGVRPPAFHDFFGRGNFHFSYRGASFSLIDSASATVEPRVYDWLADWMAESQDGDHIVAMHIPPIEPIGVRNGSFASRNEASKLLGRLARGGVDLTVYGHLHTYFEFENAGIEAHVSGGGGAIPEKFDGIGRHFLVFDVEGGHITSRRVVRVD